MSLSGKSCLRVAKYLALLLDVYWNSNQVPFRTTNILRCQCRGILALDNVAN